MTRAVAVAALLAAPAFVSAQTVPAGQIVFTEGPDDFVRGPWIDLLECWAGANGSPGGAYVNLSWNALAIGAALPADVQYAVYASNRETAGASCLKAANGVDTVAGPVGAAIAGAGPVVTLEPFPARPFVIAAGYDCNAVADTAIHVCVQAYAADGTTEVGYAKGTLTLSTSAPAPPTGVAASAAGDGALRIAWTSPSGAPEAYDFRIVAGAYDMRDPAVHEWIATQVTSLVVTGLENDLPYQVEVYARSLAGNESGPSVGTVGIPGVPPPAPPSPPPPGANGGCATGGAGPLALLALAALVRRRRSGR